MYVLKAQEQLEDISVMALAFGTLDESTRKDMMDGLYEAAGIEKRRSGRDLSKMTKIEAGSVFAQFGIPVA